MTQQLTRVPAALSRTRDLVEPALRAAVSTLADDRMRLIASYQLGWCDADGNPTEGGGKAIRPALAVLSAEAVLGSPDSGLPGAVAIELVHNFSLLHDDVMDRDTQRRHRPTGWVAFGEGDAILAGNAMLTLALEVLTETGIAGCRCIPLLLRTTQQLISGQSQDLNLEGQDVFSLTDVIAMEQGKTAALLSCAACMGALAAGAPEHIVAGLATFGHELGMAFQFVDDVLGVVGDPERTGKSSSSDLRAGKRSAPIAAALVSNTVAGRELADLLGRGPLRDEADVARATSLVIDAGGVEWARAEAESRLTTALNQLAELPLAEPAATDLAEVATFVVTRDL